MEYMKQRNRFHVIAALAGGIGLALRAAAAEKVSNNNSHAEVDRLLGEAGFCNGPCAIEALKGAQEAFGGIGGRGRRSSDGWQQLGQLARSRVTTACAGLPWAALWSVSNGAARALRGVERAPCVWRPRFGVAIGTCWRSRRKRRGGHASDQQMLGVGKDAGMA